VLDTYEDAIEILNLRNSIAVLKIMRLLLIINEYNAYCLFKLLCCTHKIKLLPGAIDYEIIEQIISDKFNERSNFNVRCNKCLFFHILHYTDKSVNDMNDIYVLMIRQQCERIIQNRCV